MLGKEGKALSLRRRLARSAAERIKKWFLMPVAPNTRHTLNSQNYYYGSS
jgi:hypothetical protein